MKKARKASRLPSLLLVISFATDLTDGSVSENFNLFEVAQVGDDDQLAIEGAGLAWFESDRNFLFRFCLFACLRGYFAVRSFNLGHPERLGAFHTKLPLGRFAGFNFAERNGFRRWRSGFDLNVDWDADPRQPALVRLEPNVR